MKTQPSPFAPSRFRFAHLGLSLILIIATTGWSPTPPAAPATVPAGFTDSLVAAVAAPTALAFTPDGRLLITSQTGQLRVYQNGSLLGAPALDFLTAWPARHICTDFERGLLGVAVDPNFVTNQHIYLFYTAVVTPSLVTNNAACQTNGVGRNSANVVNRVSRFTVSGNTVATTTETILVDNIPSLNGNHNGGDVHFGADGLLYISAGDSGTGGALARALDTLAGKILRINSDGTIPTGNPYASASGARHCGHPAGVPGGTGPCQEIIAHGLRNPYRFAFRPNSNAFYINDVGQNTWEEIDAGQVGADYGWNVREGPCANGVSCSPPFTPSAYTDPVHAYRHDTTSCGSITGGAFVPGGLWPASYDNAYLFGDYVCGKIFQMGAPGSFTSTEFGNNLGGVVHMAFGPYSNTVALHYTTYGSGGQVRRVVYTGSVNRSPTAVLSAVPTSGLAPLQVTLDATGSADLDGDPLTYDWDFGDGPVLMGTTALTTTHTYSANGVYTATLTVKDNAGGVSDPATARITVGNNPPAPTITTPLSNTLFVVGQVITLTGTAADPNEGPLPASQLTWDVLLHHNEHTHPFVTAQAGSPITFTAPPPEDLYATALSFLEIKLTATDSLGLATTITQTLNPNRVNLTFATAPAGLTVLLNGAAYSTTQSIVSWQGYGLSVSAPLQYNSGQWWMFSGWSDGGAAAHTLTTPASSATYTATFVIPTALVYLPLIAR